MPADLPACAPHVAPVTMERVIAVESGGDPLALHVNGLRIQPPRQATVQQAAATARAYIGRGYNVDLGLSQVNSRNLPALGLTIEQALDACINVSGGASILHANYVRATQEMGQGQPALLAALSAYNTGSFSAGFHNGYVAKYVSVPQLTAPVIKASAVSHVRRPPAPANPYAADTEVRWSNALLASSN